MSPPNLVMLSKIPQEKLRFQKHIEEEKHLIRHRREYEVLDRERARAQLTANSKLSKASRVFPIFKNEYENILTDLSVATAPARIREDNHQFNILSDLLQSNEIYTQEVQTEKTYIVELERRIRDVAKSVRAYAKRQITDRQFEEAVRWARNTLDTLENKLDVEVKKFNMIVAENAKMRDEIDHLLWNRRNFMTLWNKLIERLNIGKRIMLDLIEQATIAYDQREEWCTKLQTLRIKGHKDYVVNSEQVRSYKQNMDNSMKLEEFLTVKVQRRVVKDLILKQTLKKRQQQKKMKQKLKEYQGMVMKVEEFTRETDKDVIAQKYLKKEASNFSQFQYVINAIGEMEAVNDTLWSLQEDIQQQKGLQEKMANNQTRTLDLLTKELQTKSRENKTVQEEIKKLDSKLEKYMQFTLQLFQLCQCDKDPFLQLLGNQTTIKNYNLLLYLELLERAICDHLLQASYANKADKKQPKIINEDQLPSKLYTIDTIVRHHPCSLCVEHEMVSDVVEKPQRVWSRTEVKERLRTRLNEPDPISYLHRLSKCHLPQARHLLQQRYT